MCTYAFDHDFLCMGLYICSSKGLYSENVPCDYKGSHHPHTEALPYSLPVKGIGTCAKKSVGPVSTCSVQPLCSDSFG